MPTFKTSTVLLTEKGKVRQDIRTRLTKHVANKPELFAKAKEVKPNIYEIPYSSEQPDGTVQTVYVRFEVKVSERSATELAEPKKGSKATAGTGDIEID